MKLTARSRLEAWANISRIQSDEETYGLGIVCNRCGGASYTDRHLARNRGFAGLPEQRRKLEISEEGMNLLQQRIAAAVERHGSIRAAARVLEVDHAYLWRLLNGDKDNPSDALLRRLGIRKVTTYHETEDSMALLARIDAAIDQARKR